MSTDFISLKPIKWDELLDGRLAPDVTEHPHPDASQRSRCLTDGENYIWVREHEGCARWFTRYGGNNPNFILGTIACVFEAEFVSEYQPQYWGFQTQSEWDEALTKLAQRADDRLYEDIIRYLLGEPHGLTAGMEMAEMAAQLVSSDPTLFCVTRKEDLLREIERRDHSVFVPITAQELEQMAEFQPISAGMPN